MPTVTIGDNTGDDYSGTEDAHMKENNPTLNYGGTTTFEITNYDTGDYTNTLLKFSGLSNIPVGATVSASTLYIFQSDSAGTEITATAKKILRDWEEGTQDGVVATDDTPDSCCWDDYAGSVAWTSGGANSDNNDRSSTVTGTMVISSASAEYKTMTSAQLATDVEAMSDGTNYGWQLQRTDGGADNLYNVYVSSNGNDGSKPYISVTYTEGGGGRPLPARALDGSFAGAFGGCI